MPEKSVETLLHEEGYRFDFFQAVRMLDWLGRDRESVGHDGSPISEVVRFHSYPSLSFPPSPIFDITPPEDPGGPVHMTVAFMGLIGPQGVLPRHYTEMVLDRIRERDRTLLDFLDLFSHRFVSFFYRAWEKYYVPVAYERIAVNEKRRDPMTGALQALIGLATNGLQEQLEFSASALLGYAGLIGQRPRSALALQLILRDYFQLPVQVKQFIGEWLNISEGDQTRLTTKEGNNTLGEMTIVGTQIWDQQSRFHLQLGPLNLADFTRMLPSGGAYPALVQLTRFFAGQEFNFDVQLILKAEEVPFCRLSDEGEGLPRLGWTSWLKCAEYTEDVGDVIFAGEVGWTAPGARLASVA